MDEFTQVFVWGVDTFGQLGLGGKTSGKTYRVPKLCSFNILIKEISCGEDHSAFLSQSGYIYTMGSNSEGRLGIGSLSTKESHSPCLVEALMNYKCSRVSCGWGHTIAVTEQGEAYAWGMGEYGALGTSSTENQCSPSLMNICRGSVVEVSCGSRHSGLVVLERSGRRALLMCGAGEAGQLGTGRREKESTPVVVDTNEEVHSVACGIFQTAVLTSGGRVLMMGGNSFGQLGIGNKKSQCRPERVKDLDGVCITKVCCNNYTAALSDKGMLYVWGTGVFGEFLAPHKLSFPGKIRDFSIGTGFGIAIDYSNQMFGWGSNNDGELGIEDVENAEVPSAIGALKGKQVERIACGGKFCIALGKDVLKKTSNQDTGRKSAPLMIRGKINVEKYDYSKVNEINRSFERDMQSFSIDHQKNDSERCGNSAKELLKCKLELERCNEDRDALALENRELHKCLSEIKENSTNSNDKILLYKEKVKNIKKSVETWKNSMKSEMQKKEDRNLQEIDSLREKFNIELSKRNRLEIEMQKINHSNFAHENTIKKYQVQTNELHDEIQEYLKKWETDKLKSKNELEKCYTEISHLKKQQESLLLEKNDSSAFFKQEIQKEVGRFNLELNHYKQKLDNVNQEIKILQSDYSFKMSEYIKENEELNSQCEEYKNKIRIFESKEDDYRKILTENAILQKRIEYLHTDKESMNTSLSAEIGEISSENKKITESFTIEIQKLIRENSEIKKKNSELLNEKNALVSETYKLSEEINSLSKNYEKNFVENKNNVSKIQQLTIENAELENKIKNWEDKEEVIFQLSSEKNSAQAENTELKSSLHSKMTEISMIDEKLSKFMHENNYLAHTVEDMQKKLDKLSQVNKENQVLYTQDTEIKKELQSNYSSLIEENNKLKFKVSDLEEKNRNIFENLEKDLAQKAKDYKERTMNMLSVPRSSSQSINPLIAVENIETYHLSRASSPFLRPRTPNIFIENLHDNPNGNTAAKLLQALEKSPRVRSSQAKSTTPTKENIKARIATLVQNRYKLEGELNKLQD